MEKYEKIKILLKILSKIEKNLNILNSFVTYAIVSFFRCVEINYCLDAIESVKDLKNFESQRQMA